MLEVFKRQDQSGQRTARIIMISDFSSNAGINPMVAARQMKQNGVPVVTVGLGTENAGGSSRDIMLRDIIAGPTVFVKNHLEVKGTLLARGFANQTLDVELFVEDNPVAVARTKVKVPDAATVVPITGLKYIPQTPGEKQITLKVAPQDGELLPVQQPDQHVRHGAQRRAQRQVPPGWGELVLGLQVHDALDRHLAGHPRRRRGDQAARPRGTRAWWTTPNSRTASTTPIS